MDTKELERILERLMKLDFSVGTEAFREELLARCLAVLGTDEGVEIADEELELLAAAGQTNVIGPSILDVHDPLGDNGSAGLLK